MKTVYVITGQTATGKTRRAIEFSSICNGELINIDSRQIYKKLDVVTGKELDYATGPFVRCTKLSGFDVGYYPISFTTHNTRIWLYDMADPNTSMSAYDYQTCAVWVIEHLSKSGKTPIFVGGSYLYIKHLLYGTIETHVPPNQNLRTKLENQTVEQLQRLLKSKDDTMFSALNQSDRNNPHRLIRKIELASSPRKKSINENSRLDRDWKIEISGLYFQDKLTLAQQIRKRVEARISQGAIEETESLLKSGYTDNSPGLRTIGYRQIIDYLHRVCTKEEMIEWWIRKEVQYAKRQRTFMRENPAILWTPII